MPDKPTTVPKLDLAPKLNRPLSLWNPLDYLRLLYWVFFFPQAIRWYVDKFGKVQYNPRRGNWRTLLSVLRQDRVQRDLYIQNLVLIVAVPVLAGVFAQSTGLPWNWGGVVSGVAFGVVFGVVVGVAVGVAGGVAVGVAFGVALGLAFSWTAGLPVGEVRIMALSVSIPVAFGVACSVASAMMLAMWFVLALGVVITVALGAASGVMVGAVSSVLVGVAVGVVYGMVSSVVFGIILCRLPDYLFLWLPAQLAWREGAPQRGWLWSHLTWLPFPGFPEQLQDWVAMDWDKAIDNTNELLAYTLQFISVVRAWNVALGHVSKERLLAAVDRLALKLFEWDLLCWCSASLSDAMWLDMLQAIFFIPRRLKRPFEKRFSYEVRLDTLPRAACAGFWLLHIQNPKKATEAFTITRALPNGEELYQIAFLLASAQDCKDLHAIAGFVDASRWLASPPESPLRPEALKTLSRLRSIALDAAVANESISKLNRAAALNRALGELTQLLDDVGQTCPHPEREIVQKIAEQWRDALGRAAGEIGQIVVEKPVENPYVVGNPVVGKQFVGRDEILQRLEELWSGTGQRPSVVLYGHRRMGKSSILQNLGQYRFGADTAVAYFNMQRVARPEHTGELLYDIAVALWRACEKPVFSEKTGFWSEPTLDDYQQNWYARFNRFLRELDVHRNGRRFILTMDEFELIEDLINDGKVEHKFMDFLRGIIQTEPWLILALAGLHTLNEMTSNYFEPLYASVVPVHVSFLNEASLRQVIANPSEDFPLDYDRAAHDLIWRLTNGQPYLAQLIGHNLVRAFNQARFEQGHARETKFTVADVEAIITASDFYEQGGYYFNGLWTQAQQSQPAHQTDILRVLAPHRDGLPFAEILAQTHLDESTARAALETLKQHDVVEEVDGTWRYHVELMRRWVESK